MGLSAAPQLQLPRKIQVKRSQAPKITRALTYRFTQLKIGAKIIIRLNHPNVICNRTVLVLLPAIGLCWGDVITKLNSDTCERNADLTFGASKKHLQAKDCP